MMVSNASVGSVVPHRLAPETPPAWWARVIVALGCLGAGAAVRLLAAPVLDDRVPFITFFPAVLAASIWGGWLAGAIVLAATPLLVGYLLTPAMSGYRLDMGSSVAFLIAGGLMVVVGALLADSLRRERLARAEQRKAEEQLRSLVSELGHRAKNGLTMVTAIAEQSARRASSVDDYRDRLIARLQAMSHSQDAVTQAQGGPVKLSDLLERILDPFDLDRFEITGPADTLTVNEAAALGLSLIFHELATNAVKYGSLSAQGLVRVECGPPAPVAQAHWIERGGPPVTAPTEQGFGTRLIGLTLRNEGGGADVSYLPDGVRCLVRFPTVTA